MAKGTDAVQPSLLSKILEGTIGEISKAENFTTSHVEGFRALVDKSALVPDRLSEILMLEPEEGVHEDH